jgi:hypothetical protein
MPAILATQEAEIRKIMVWSQAGKIVQETLSQRKHHKRAGRVAQGIGPKFKPQYHLKKIFLWGKSTTILIFTDGGTEAHRS